MRYLIAVIAALLVAVAWAIDPPRPQAPATPPPPAQEQTDPQPVPASKRPDIAESEAEAKAKAEAEAEVEEVLPPLPADQVPAGSSPARFNPTEKVRADFPVSFPIDI
jgi:hypothetical protein